MSEWASGIVDVTGTKSAIEQFLKRFLYEEDKEDAEPRNRYFARSVLYESRNRIQEELDSIFLDAREDEERAYRIYPEFAWSAAYCLSGPYTTKYPEKCVGLTSACAEDQVDVIIRTSCIGRFSGADPMQPDRCPHMPGRFTTQCSLQELW